MKNIESSYISRFEEYLEQILKHNTSQQKPERNRIAGSLQASQTRKGLYGEDDMRLRATPDEE